MSVQFKMVWSKDREKHLFKIADRAQRSDACPEITVECI